MKRINNMEVSDSYLTPSKVMLVESSTGVNLVNRYAATKSSPQDLIALAMEIEKADNFVKANAKNKLHVIAEQMRFLKNQAQKVLIEAKENDMLHHAACNFVKHPGNIYHLYEKPSGQFYFSMLSPEEWGDGAPLQVYKGSYRLEHDQSWTPVSQIKAKDAELNVFDKFLFKNQTLPLNSLEVMSIDY
ncbi:GSCOCG00010610001-RA-CDS [Cotesia congregata]|uniref:Similar to Uncharacterized protein C1orf50 homolog (Xenopus laevis) n=1 Tax=Cotesia congregata TaxID=51543 RepID=A0A8J2MRP7_COTCN|nr:GSCOCG00010610001-RA-CDS [Cotesia congregata]CAG5104212.1 Similar to Uncharacterized protein C1orf50 homolog (Xenopus laevis) [Cotesia congregata]